MNQLTTQNIILYQWSVSSTHGTSGFLLITIWIFYTLKQNGIGKDLGIRDKKLQWV